MSRCNLSLVIVVNLKAKHNIYATAMMSYILMKQQLVPTEGAYFLNIRVYYHTSFQDSVLSGDNVAPTSNVRGCII
jgi:hypothetical protein